ncbi:DUF6566 family protein [Burkholderia ubonensis]|uniref:DUF6566 family protein n=1 Tax=Burkholderia ubonensis TaxID=101571 RepID=UPI001E448544|nr:DUF6566 family protein [Burkholderia ubonensis]
MPNTMQAFWKEHAIEIRTIPVRHIVTCQSPPDSFVAIVRIERDGQVLADWHLPKFSERWATEREAYDDAFEYAVKLIDRGALSKPGYASAPVSYGIHNDETRSQGNGGHDEHGSAEVEPVQVPAQDG